MPSFSRDVGCCDDAECVLLYKLWECHDLQFGFGKSDKAAATEEGYGDLHDRVWLLLTTSSFTLNK